MFATPSRPTTGRISTIAIGRGVPKPSRLPRGDAASIGTSCPLTCDLRSGKRTGRGRSRRRRLRPNMSAWRAGCRNGLRRTTSLGGKRKGSLRPVRIGMARRGDAIVVSVASDGAITLHNHRSALMTTIASAQAVRASSVLTAPKGVTSSTKDEDDAAYLFNIEGRRSHITGRS